MQCIVRLSGFNHAHLDRNAPTLRLGLRPRLKAGMTPPLPLRRREPILVVFVHPSWCMGGQGTVRLRLGRMWGLFGARLRLWSVRSFPLTLSTLEHPLGAYRKSKAAPFYGACFSCWCWWGSCFVSRGGSCFACGMRFTRKERSACTCERGKWGSLENCTGAQRARKRAETLENMKKTCTGVIGARESVEKYVLRHLARGKARNICTGIPGARGS